MSAADIHTQDLTGDEAELLTGAVNAIRRGRMQLLLSYVLAGFYCWEFVVAQGRRKVPRAEAIDKLRAVLTPEADTKRERDPNHLIRTYGSLNLLSGGEAERWARTRGQEGYEAPAFAGALGISKAQVLTPLVNQPAGTDGFTWARGDGAEARAIFAWACGPEAPTGKEIELRVGYHLGPAKGRQVELKQRLERCETAADYDGVIEWARSQDAEAALPDGSPFLGAALAAKARVFPPAPGEELRNFPGGLGAMSESDLAGAEDLAPVLTDAITRHRHPDDVLERLLRLLVASGDLSGKAKRAASAALVILTRGKAAGGRPVPSGAPVPAGAS